MNLRPLNLQVRGIGVVSPAGMGPAALAREFPGTEESSLDGSGVRWPVSRIDMKEPWTIPFQKEPRLRRASSLAYFLAEAVSQALQGAGDIPKPRIGLIGAFFTGSLVYSRRFYADIVRRGQSFASPALFPETVFNSPLSHAAAVHGLSGNVYAMVGDETVWVTALQTATTWLALNRVDAVVVVGAEELDAVAMEAYACAGWLKGAEPIRPSEGAGALLVCRGRTPDSGILASSASRPYASSRKAGAAVASVLAGFPSSCPVWPSARLGWFHSLEKKWAGSRLTEPLERSRDYAFTASAAWDTIRCILRASGTEQMIQPVWGCNHQISALHLRAPQSKFPGA
jgi:hypothetical protein